MKAVLTRPKTIVCDACWGKGERFAMEGYDGEPDGPEDYNIVKCLKCDGTGRVPFGTPPAPVTTRAEARALGIIRRSPRSKL